MSPVNLFRLIVVSVLCLQHSSTLCVCVCVCVGWCVCVRFVINNNKQVQVQARYTLYTLPQYVCISILQKKLQLVTSSEKKTGECLGGGVVLVVWWSVSYFYTARMRACLCECVGGHVTVFQPSA